MLVIEFKARANAAQSAAIDEAIRTAQFVRNKCLRLWMDEKGKGLAYCVIQSKDLVA